MSILTCVFATFKHTFNFDVSNRAVNFEYKKNNFIKGGGAAYVIVINMVTWTLKIIVFII